MHNLFGHVDLGAEQSSYSMEEDEGSVIVVSGTRLQG